MIVVRRGDNHLSTAGYALADDRGIGALEANTDGHGNPAPVASRHPHERGFIPGLHVLGGLGGFGGERRDELAEGNELTEGYGHVLGVACFLVDSHARTPDRKPILYAVTVVEVRVTDKDRRIQGHCRLINDGSDIGEGNGITIHRSFAP